MISLRPLPLLLALGLPLLPGCQPRLGEACRCADECEAGLECVAPIGRVSSCLHPADAGGVCVKKGEEVIIQDDIDEAGQLDDELIDEWLTEFDSGGEETGPGADEVSGSGSSSSGGTGTGTESGTGTSESGSEATSGSDATGDLESSSTTDLDETSEAGEGEEAPETDAGGTETGSEGESDTDGDSESTAW